MSSNRGECDAQSAVREQHGFEKRWAQFGPVHCALNFNLANVTLVEVAGGYVAIDAGPSIETAEEIKRQFGDRASGDPLAIIYTHSHADHIRGAPVFHSSGTPIWAQEQFHNELATKYKLTRAHVRRAAKQFGTQLPSELAPTNGIGPRLDLGAQIESPILYPTDTVRSFEEVEYGDLCFELHAAPGETHDHLFVWMPEIRTLHAGDNFYRAFPNLYTIRGASPRPVEQWIASLDRMRRLRPAPEVLVLGHTEPIVGADRIAQLLTDYRDAIAMVHDSVVRGINADLSPDALAEQIRLPPSLANHDFLQENYGTVRGAVRGVYDAYMGWFDGRAAHLDPLPRSEVAARLMPRLGGREGLANEMQKALEAGDLRWAAWLGDHLLESDARDKRIRAMQAETLRRLGEMEANPLMKNWYFSDASELTGAYPAPKMPKATAAAIGDMPIETLLAVFPSRLHPLRSAKVAMSVGFDFSDSGKQFTFFIRRGVGELAPFLDESADVVVRASEQDFKRALIAGEVKPLSRDFMRALKFEVSGAGPLRPIRALRQLARFARCMIKA